MIYQDLQCHFSFMVAFVCWDSYLFLYFYPRLMVGRPRKRPKFSVDLPKVKSVSYSAKDCSGISCVSNSGRVKLPPLLPYKANKGKPSQSGNIKSGLFSKCSLNLMLKRRLVYYPNKRTTTILMQDLEHFLYTVYYTQYYIYQYAIIVVENSPLASSIRTSSSNSMYYSAESLRDSIINFAGLSPQQMKALP